MMNYGVKCEVEITLPFFKKIADATGKYFKKVCFPNFSYVHIVSNSFLLQEAFSDSTEGVPGVPYLGNTNQSVVLEIQDGGQNQILYFQIEIGK